MNERRDRLPAYYYDFTKKVENGVKSDITVKKDLDREKRRAEILALVNERLAEKSLSQRLNGNGNNIGDVIREGLLGHLFEETLLSDIFPQGDGLHAYSKITKDPLWAKVCSRLDSNQKNGILGLFSAVEKFNFKREMQRLPLKQSAIITIGEARGLHVDGWSKIDGIGEARAQLLVASFRKVE